MNQTQNVTFVTPINIIFCFSLSKKTKAIDATLFFDIIDLYQQEGRLCTSSAKQNNLPGASVNWSRDCYPWWPPSNMSRSLSAICVTICKSPANPFIDILPVRMAHSTPWSITPWWNTRGSTLYTAEEKSALFYWNWPNFSNSGSIKRLFWMPCRKAAWAVCWWSAPWLTPPPWMEFRPVFYPTTPPEVQRQVILFCVSGLLSMVLLWHRDGYVQSPEQMARIATRLLDQPLFPNLEHILWNSPFSRYFRRWEGLIICNTMSQSCHFVPCDSPQPLV